MVRKIFFVAVLFVAVVGCTRVEEVGSEGSGSLEYDSRAINFETQATKALSGGVATMQSDDGGFVVYGVETDAESWYENLGGSRYIYDSITQMWGWQGGVEPLWPLPFTQMNFYAYYPPSPDGFTLVSDDLLDLAADIVVEPSILDQTDYLASVSGDITSKPITGMQPLTFDHIMSKVSFSVLQDEGILTIIRQLGIENIINSGTYDYVNSQWRNLSSGKLGSFSDYVGSSGVFAKYGVESQIDPIRIDGHYLMLIPQSGGEGEGQTPVWDGSVEKDGTGEFTPSGAYISIRYRMSAATDTEDIVGYAFRETSPDDSEWEESSYYYSVYKKVGGIYNGPLFVKAGFRFTAEQFSWIAAAEYDYNLRLSDTGGIYLSEYYYDVDGTNTKIRVTGEPSVGDRVFAGDITFSVSVNDWGHTYTELSLY